VDAFCYSYHKFLFFLYGFAVNFCRQFISIAYTFYSPKREAKMLNPQAIPQAPGYFQAVQLTASPVSQLREKYEKINRLYQEQPEPVQRFISSQTLQLGQAIVQSLSVIRFSLPSQVVLQGAVFNIPPSQRQQTIGGFFDRAARKDTRTAFKQRLAKLEWTSNPALTICTSLIRYATAVAIVHAILPSGQSVTYRALDGEEIPTIPLENTALPPTASREQRFFLPQWVALDSQGNLLVKSHAEASSYLVSMQQYLNHLQVAIDLAPYMVVDEIYQQKRYGMVGQLVNQGRALAWYETVQAINLIQRRAAGNDLNRGLQLSLPYFDDQRLELRKLEFTIVPTGRCMFVPTFVVLAARREQSLVAQDTRLSLTTRKYLLAELSMLEKTFYTLSETKL
jgi:hypothetical protein